MSPPAPTRLRLRQPDLLLAALLALTTWLYWPTFTRYFVSEDFIFLRLFETRPFADILWDNLTGTWLGLLGVVSYYRPISTLLLQIEHLFLGKNERLMEEVRA